MKDISGPMYNRSSSLTARLGILFVCHNQNPPHFYILMFDLFTVLSLVLIVNMSVCFNFFQKIFFSGIKGFFKIQ